MLQLTANKKIMAFFAGVLVLALLAASTWVQFFPATLFFSAAVMFTSLSASFLLGGPLFLLTLLGVVLLHTALVAGLRAYGAKKFAASSEELALHGRGIESLQKWSLLFVVTILCFALYNTGLLAGSLSLTALFLAGPAMTSLVALLWGVYLLGSLLPLSARDIRVHSLAPPLSVHSTKREMRVQDGRLKKESSSQVEADKEKTQRQRQPLQSLEEEAKPVASVMDSPLPSAMIALLDVENTDEGKLCTRDAVVKPGISRRDEPLSLQELPSQESEEGISQAKVDWEENRQKQPPQAGAGEAKTIPPAISAQLVQEIATLLDVGNTDATILDEGDSILDSRISLRDNPLSLLESPSQNNRDANPECVVKPQQETVTDPADLDLQEPLTPSSTASQDLCSLNTEEMFLTPKKKIQPVSKNALASTSYESSPEVKRVMWDTELEDSSAVTIHYDKRDRRCPSKQSPKQIIDSPDPVTLLSRVSQNLCSLNREEAFLTPKKKVQLASKNAVVSASPRNSPEIKSVVSEVEPEDSSTITWHYDKRDRRCPSKQSPKQVTKEEVTSASASPSTISSSAPASPASFLLSTQSSMTPIEPSSSHAQIQQRLGGPKVNAGSRKGQRLPTTLPLPFSGYECRRRHLNHGLSTPRPKRVSEPLPAKPHSRSRSRVEDKRDKTAHRFPS